MKKVSLVLVLVLVCTALFSACRPSAENALEERMTIQQWLEDQGGREDAIMTVEIVEIVNPVYALVKDDSGEVMLYGVVVDGEFQDFAAAGLSTGDRITISGGQYNMFEGVVEIKEANLLSVERDEA